LGVRPMLGRTFTAEEGRAGTEAFAIIGADIWSSRFGGAKDVIGRPLRLNGVDHIVVGVMDDGFRFPYAAQRIWLPLDIRNPPPAQVRAVLTMTARMRPGITRQQLNERVDALAPEMKKQALRPWPMLSTTHYLDARIMDDTTRRSIWLLF